MLRKTLLFFGWAIPILTILMIVGNVAIAVSLKDFESTSGTSVVGSIFLRVLNDIRLLSLSPLCFFGAHMLKIKLS